MTTDSRLQTLEKAVARLHALKRVLGSWEAVASEIGVSLGTTVRVSQGYEPRNPGLRAKFGLPLLRPAPVCTCGEVHTRKTCPNRPRKPRKPGLTPRQKKAVRLLGGLWC